MEILTVCCSVTELLERLRKVGSKLAISDVACGAAACRAAMQCAALNVRINVAGLKNRDTADALHAQMQDMLDEYEPRAEAILRSINEELEGKR